MNNEQLVELFLETATLKRMPRTGWGMRGVAHVESVADHSFGVAFMALSLADVINAADGDGPLDLEAVLVMALLHDLAEVRLTDLPASAVRLIPGEVKSQAEGKAVAALLAPLPQGARLQAFWQSFEDQDSREGRLVRDADKLEMMVQCLRYEQAGSRGLQEFWDAMDRRTWHYPLCAQLYGQLRAQRPEAAT